MTPIDWASIIVGAAFAAAGVAMLAGGLVQASRVARVLGDEFMVYADVGTFSVGRFAVRLRETMHVGIGLMLGALLVVSNEYYYQHVRLLWLAGILIAASSLRLSTQMVPGCILVLGRSAPDTLGLQATINQLLAPFRAISLLKMADDDDAIRLRAHSFRLGPNSDWVGAVQTLATFMPLVVLDLRDSSEYVEDEVRIVLEKKYLYKTVFVTRDGNAAPLHTRAAELGLTAPDGEILCVSGPDDCIQMLRHVLFSARQAPTREQPITQVAALDR
jgi:hypothetical protein